MAHSLDTLLEMRSCTLRLNYYCARRDPVICLSARASRYVWNSVDIVSLSQGRVRLRLDWYATHAADYLGCRGKTNNSRAARVGESESTLPTMCTVYWMGVKTDLATGLLMIDGFTLGGVAGHRSSSSMLDNQIKHLIHGVRSPANWWSKLVVGGRQKTWACPIDRLTPLLFQGPPSRPCLPPAMQQQCKSRACRWPWH